MIGRDSEAERLADLVNTINDLTFHYELLTVRGQSQVYYLFPSCLIQVVRGIITVGFGDLDSIQYL